MHDFKCITINSMNIEQNLKQAKLKLSRIITASNNTQLELEEIKTKLKEKTVELKSFDKIEERKNKEIVLLEKEILAIENKKESVEISLNDVVLGLRISNKELLDFTKEIEKKKKELSVLSLNKQKKIQDELTQASNAKEKNIKIKKVTEKLESDHTVCKKSLDKVTKELLGEKKELVLVKKNATQENKIVESLMNRKKDLEKENSRLLQLNDDQKIMHKEKEREYNESTDEKKENLKEIDNQIKKEKKKLDEIKRYRFNLSRKGHELKKLHEYIVEVYKQANVQLPVVDFDLVIPEIDEE